MQEINSEEVLKEFGQRAQRCALHEVGQTPCIHTFVFP
jgi:hypothetical protein